MMTEHDLQNLIRLELSKLGYVVFRTNVGKVKILSDIKRMKTIVVNGEKYIKLSDK